MKKLFLGAMIFASMMNVVVSNAHAEDASFAPGSHPVQLTLDTNLAITDATVSTLTPLQGNSQVVLQGTLDNYGTFRQTPGTKALFYFTSRQTNKNNSTWFRNLKSNEADIEWFQDVKIVFEKGNFYDRYYISQVDSHNSVIWVCRDAVQPVCLKFNPFGQSLRLLQSGDHITYYIMDPIARQSDPSIMLQFKLSHQ